jgi:hypothetical protein
MSADNMPAAPQSLFGGLGGSPAILRAVDFTPDGRPVFPAHMRDLPPSIILAASFSIAIGGRIEDRRAPHETTVAVCGGGSCAIADNVAPNG